MKFIHNLLAILSFGLWASSVSAGGMIYVGAGAANEDPTISGNNVPYVVGVLGLPETGGAAWGVDIANEGIFHDSTWGGDEYRQAFSYNFLAGGNLYRRDALRIDAAGIFGIRPTFADCADSFVGWRCYADATPNYEFAFNYGALLAFSY